MNNNPNYQTSEVHYFRAVEYHRIHISKLEEFLELRENFTYEKEEDFFNKIERALQKHKRNQGLYTQEYNNYFNKRSFYLQITFRLVDRILFSFLKDFPSSTSIDNQISLFPLTPSSKKKSQTSLIFRGQEKKRFFDGIGLNLIDNQTLSAIVTFFKQSNLISRATFLQAFLQLNTSDFENILIHDYSPFIKNYRNVMFQPNNKTNHCRNLLQNDTIDWKDFVQTIKWIDYNFFELKRLFYFLEYSLNFRNHFLVLRQYHS